MTAEELLTMSDDIYVYSVDESLQIDAENRTILTPAGGLLLGVVSDKDAERIEFVCPRFVGDNIDLSAMQLRIIYSNANKEKDYWICTDTFVDGENVKFSWLLSKKVTRYKGSVNFIVCAIRTQADGSIQNEWNTTLAEGRVLEGLEIDDIPESELEEPRDLVMQLLGILESKAEEALKDIQEKVDFVKTNSIKVTSSGETIVRTDTADAEFEGLKVFGKSEQFTTTGKNLFDADTYNANGGNITFDVEGGRTLYRSAGLGGSGYWGVYDANDILLGTFADYNFTANNPLTLPDTASYIKVSKDIWAGDLYIGYDSDITYEPYTGGVPSPNPDYPQEIKSLGDDGSVDVEVYGKNFIVINKASTTHNGITYTPNLDGSVTLNGTATETQFSFFNLNYIDLNTKSIPTGDYIVNGGYSSNVRVQIMASGASIAGSKGGDTLFSIKEEDKNSWARIIVESGTTVSNVIIYPMVRSASCNSELFEKGKEPQALTVSTPNGLPAIKVKDSSLATYTDSDGQMWCADEIDFARGKYIQRIKTVTLNGSINILHNTDANYSEKYGYNYAYRLFKDKMIVGQDVAMPCMSNIGTTNSFGKSEGVHSGGLNTSISVTFSDERTGIMASDDNATIVSKINNVLKENPITIKYLLAEPIETDLTAEEIEAYKSLHSNYPTTTVMNDCNAFTEVTMVADTKNHIEQNYVPVTSYNSLVERVSALENALV